MSSFRASRVWVGRVYLWVGRAWFGTGTWKNFIVFCWADLLGRVAILQHLVSKKKGKKGAEAKILKMRKKALVAHTVSSKTFQIA